MIRTALGAPEVPEVKISITSSSAAARPSAAAVTPGRLGEPGRLREPGLSGEPGLLGEPSCLGEPGCLGELGQAEGGKGQGPCEVLVGGLPQQQVHVGGGGVPPQFGRRSGRVERDHHRTAERRRADEEDQVREVVAQDAHMPGPCQAPGMGTAAADDLAPRPGEVLEQQPWTVVVGSSFEQGGKRVLGHPASQQALGQPFRKLEQILVSVQCLAAS
ncbi:hypothetical protein GCM10020219_031470 [Nonomuraea dietziae]